MWKCIYLLGSFNHWTYRYPNYERYNQNKTFYYIPLYTEAWRWDLPWFLKGFFINELRRDNTDLTSERVRIKLRLQLFPDSLLYCFCVLACLLLIRLYHQLLWPTTLLSAVAGRQQKERIVYIQNIPLNWVNLTFYCAESVGIFFNSVYKIYSSLYIFCFYYFYCA